MIVITDDDVRVRLVAFFGVFPGGAGAQWLAAFLGVPRAQSDRVCSTLGARRVRAMIFRPSAAGVREPVPAEESTEWRLPCRESP